MAPRLARLGLNDRPVFIQPIIVKLFAGGIAWPGAALDA
jgi:hypothetical protein